MANRINTIQNVLNELNNGLPNQPWYPIPSVFTLKSASVTNGEINDDQQILVVKVFVNTTTGEIKTYVAKWLDVPETTSLL